MTTRALLFVLFFASGFAALLYQVIWQRVLAIFSGADVFSITIVVTAFMGGIGCGSVAGGYLADRLRQRQQIAVFALAELAVAGFAFFSLDFYYGVLHTHLGNLARSPVLLPIVLFGSLLWPTFFMGMSLPLLAKAMTPHLHGAARLLGALYGMNTFGGAVGAMVTTWWFMRHLGFEHTVRLGALVNLCVAIAAWLLVRGSRADAFDGSRAVLVARADPTSVVQQPDVRSGVWRWMAMYALAGLLALSLEVVWFRLLGVMLKSTSFTFGHLLGLYLFGLTVGTLAGQRWVERTARPAAVFLTLQAGVSAYAGLSLWGLGLIVPTLPHLWEYLGRYDPLTWAEFSTRPGLVIALYLALPAAIMGPPTVMMGMSFPFLQRVVQRDLATLGRRVGWLQAANIFGAMLGASLTGWAALGLLGTSATLQVLVASGVVFLLVLLRDAHADGVSRWSRLAVGAAAVLIVLVASLVPRPATLWATLHGTVAARIIHAEDASGLSVLKGSSVHMHGETLVYANGLGQSSVPFPAHHVTLGLIPLMMHPDPQDIAIVGLGSGATLYAAGGRAETRRIHVIEIVKSQLDTLRELHARTGYGGLGSLLRDPRITYTFGDARSVLRFGDRTYDIIEADALRPTSAYAGNLYSLEYFQLLKRHLRPGGFAVTWAPTPRTIDTFASVFPEGLLYQHESVAVLIGSNRPLLWRADQATQRLTSAFSRAYYARGHVDVALYVDGFARMRPTTLQQRGAGSSVDINRDLFPRDEFSVPHLSEP